MKYTTAALLVLAVSVSSIPVRRDVDPGLVPPFGLQAGLNPTGTGDCDGAVNDASGKPIKIPCSCPPPNDQFLAALNANVAAGHAVKNPSAPVSFPTDNSPGSQVARIQAVLVTLQNLNGPGVGCPAASTNLVAKQNALQARAGPGDFDDGLVPDVGIQPGVNPTGTGDCDGFNGVKIPCSCPPDRGTLLQQLHANVAAGHAVNNPGVAVTFPTDDSNAAKAGRITAVLITLQNLRGPGVGCPAASTNLLPQQQALLGA